jgi:hypothetical protein
MPLLRISDCSNLNVWDKTSEKIAEDWFDRFRDPRASFYEARCSREEVEAVAAFALTNPAKNKVYHLMRVTWEELADFGLYPSGEAPGNTGVVSVDFRHWEIETRREGLVRLVGHVQERLVAGEERFRWVGVRMQNPWWRRFCGLEDAFVIGEAKNRCRWKLANQEGGYRFRPRERVAAELRGSPPAIPKYRIAERAYRAYQMRGAAPGGPLEDWLAAERELRELYTEILLRFMNPASL